MQLQKRFLFTVFLALGINMCFAQFNATDRADSDFADLQFPKAIEAYLDIVRTGKFDDHVIHNLAESYRQIRDYKNAEIWYAQACQLRSRTPVEIWNYAMVLKSMKKYTEANNWIRLYNDVSPEDSRAIRHLTAGNYEQHLRPVLEQYVLTPVSVNTEGSDMGVAYFKDDLVVYASNVDPTGGALKRTNNIHGGSYLNLYVSKNAAGGAMTTPQKIDELSTKYNEGPACFTSDGMQIYFTRNSGKSEINKEELNLKVYRATLANGEFVNQEELPFCSSEYSVAHPSISENGNRVFFASDMPGGYGGFDIYMVPIINGFFQRPMNLGPKVNTEGDEVFPAIHSSGWLHYASDGLLGLGGYDIFKTKYVGGDWLVPVNMMAPINSEVDDFCFVADSILHTGFITSNRLGGKGNDDIYAWRFDETAESYNLYGKVIDENGIRAKGVTVYLKNQDGDVLANTKIDKDGYFGFEVNRLRGYLIETNSTGYTSNDLTIKAMPVGKVKNIEIAVIKKNYGVHGVIRSVYDDSPIAGVTVEVTKVSSKLRMEYETKEDGFFSFIIDPESSYDLKITKAGYLDLERKFNSFELSSGEPFVLEDLYLQQLVAGQTIEIPNVEFTAGTTQLGARSTGELDKVVEFLETNVGITVEIANHTDSRGEMDANLVLSQQRADAIVEYLMMRGVPADRLVAKGYGEYMLINGCRDDISCTEAEHAENVRTEMRIVQAQ